MNNEKDFLCHLTLNHCCQWIKNIEFLIFWINILLIPPIISFNLQDYVEKNFIQLIFLLQQQF